MKQTLRETLIRIGGGHLLNEGLSDNDQLLDKSSKSWIADTKDIIKALKKDSKIVKHVGKEALNDPYFDDLDFVADNDDGTTITRLKYGMTLKDLKKAILKANPKKWKN